MKLAQRFGCLVLLAVMVAGTRGFGQAPNPVRPITRPPRVLPVIQIAPRIDQFTPDPFDSMVASAASFDMDSPVEASAEFEPAIAAAGGQVVYRLRVSALDESLKAPDQLPAPNGLELHTGGRGQTYQPVGGMKLRPQTTIIYRATVTNTGTFTIPAFEVTAYGKPVKVPAATLTVVPAGTIAAVEPPSLLLELPKGDVYVGQLLRIPLILPVPPDGSLHGLSQPRITGKFIFSEPFSPGFRQENMQRHGKTFMAYLQDVLITPLREGPQELIGQAHAYSFRPVQPNVMPSSPLLVDSEPVKLTVKPLPEEGRLPGFTGAVGEFQLERPKLSVSELRAGEPLALTVILRGDGNLGRLTPPPLPALHDWQGFDPIPDATSAAVILQRGFASFTYTLIPLSPNLKFTPAIPFSYFDPRLKSYVDLTIPPLPIIVTPGANEPVAQTPPDGSGPDTDDAAGRERPLRLTGLIEKPGGAATSLRPLQQKGSFLAFQIVPAALLAGLWGWDRRRRYLARHPEVILKRRARRGLRRQWQIARRAAAAGDAAGFVAGAAGALREACAPHAPANPQALVCADVLEQLPAPDREDSAAEIIRRLFAAADALRFGGPVKDGAELLALQPGWERVLEQLRARL